MGEPVGRGPSLGRGVARKGCGASSSSGGSLSSSVASVVSLLWGHRLAVLPLLQRILISLSFTSGDSLQVLPEPSVSHALWFFCVCIYLSFFISFFCSGYLPFHPPPIEVYFYCCCSATKLCPTLCDPMDCSMPGFPVFLCISQSLLKLMSIESWCHPTISSSVTPFSSCLQSFPASGSFPVVSLHQVARVLDLQYQSFQWIFKADFL